MVEFDRLVARSHDTAIQNRYTTESKQEIAEYVALGCNIRAPIGFPNDSIGKTNSDCMDNSFSVFM